MSTEHYCEKCGRKMKRTARCEFYCKNCDNTIFDWSLKYSKEDEYENKSYKEHHSDFELADFCRGGDLTED